MMMPLILFSWLFSTSLFLDTWLLTPLPLLHVRSRCISRCPGNLQLEFSPPQSIGPLRQMYFLCFVFFIFSECLYWSLTSYTSSVVLWDLCFCSWFKSRIYCFRRFFALKQRNVTIWGQYKARGQRTSFFLSSTMSKCLWSWTPQKESWVYSQIPGLSPQTAPTAGECPQLRRMKMQHCWISCSNHRGNQILGAPLIFGMLMLRAPTSLSQLSLHIL